MRKTYSEKLQDPEWQKKRLLILSRDSFTCLLCGDKNTTLHVHHKEYLPGRKPWEYEDDNFQTLCKHCHLVSEKVKAFSDYVIAVNKRYDPAIEAYVLMTVVFTHTGIELILYTYSPKYDELNTAVIFSEQDISDFYTLINQAKTIQNPNNGKRSSSPMVLE
jgi:hypothetical protein